MKLILAGLLMAASLSAQAGLIATAEGVVTSGCNNCGSDPNYDLFGLGPNVDLAGYAFSVQFNITDALLSSQPYFRADGSIKWETNRALDLTASITLNNHTYELPTTSVTTPSYTIHPDGTVSLYFVNENATMPVGYESPDYGPYFAYDHLSMTENDSLWFRSSEFLLDRITHVPVFDLLTDFSGVIGDITIRPATSVPEPGSMALLGLGMAGMIAFRRRRGLIKKPALEPASKRLWTMGYRSQGNGAMLTRTMWPEVPAHTLPSCRSPSTSQKDGRASRPIR